MPTPKPVPHDARLHVVTGKGGTGKTTVAAALAVMLARGGRRVLVAEIEGRQGLSEVFGAGPLGYREHLLTRADGGQVLGLSVDAESALLEYLVKFYRAGPVGGVLRKLGAVEFVTTIAPGLRDVLLTGKIYEAVRRQDRTGFDAVVLDAPPTGRVTNVLNINAEVAQLARVGPIHQQAESIMRVFRSPQTVVHLTTLLEEMPVQETVDTRAQLAGLGLPAGVVFANRVQPETLSAKSFREADDTRLMADLVAGGVVRSGHEHTARSAALIGALRRDGQAALTRGQLQSRERQRLSGSVATIVDLPDLIEGIGPASIGVLADRIAAQWPAGPR